MKDLKKIASSEELTYLQKVAAIVDEFAAGNVSGEDADAIAQEAGISPEDLLAMHTAVYGEGGIEKTASVEVDLEKVAADAADYLVKLAEDENATYLTKCAGIADAYAAGAVTAEEGDAIAEEMGLNPYDVAEVFVAAYGTPESGDIEKTAAAQDAVDFLVKVAESEDSTYLEKCAGVADAYMADAITADEAVAISGELGLETSDVDSVIEAAYGDVLEKEAGAKEVAAKVLNKIKGAGESAKNFYTKDFSRGASRGKRLESLKEASGKEGISDERKKRIEGIIGAVRKGALKDYAKGAGKVAGTTAVVGGTGYGATKLFGKNEK